MKLFMVVFFMLPPFYNLIYIRHGINEYQNYFTLICYYLMSV
ncbi:hypothetical protein PANA5342_1485 [Pantoea ananatis LMG 5342]|nr:hypothetical protein PANA5342_1485 [Pantoea ananatis LMG 5342]